MMFGVLDRYIGKTIFSTILTTLFTLVSLSGIIKFVDQLRRTGQGDYGVIDAGYFTLLNIPEDIDIFFPLAVLLGALLGLGVLAQRSELIALQAASFTRMQIALAVMKTALPLVIITMFVTEYLAPNSSQMAHNYRAQQILGGALVSTQYGLWAKDGRDFIFIERLNGEDHLEGVTIYTLSAERRLARVRYAASAQWDKTAGLWRLAQTEESDLASENQISGSQHLVGEWKTALTPDKLKVVSLDPGGMSIRELATYSRYLKQSGQVASSYLLNMWSKLFKPLSVAVMLLMALSCIFGPLRSVSMGVRLIAGISLGFVFYALDKIFGPLSLVYGIPPILGALLPSLLFLFISLLLLAKLR